MRKILTLALVLFAALAWANPEALIDQGSYKDAYQEALSLHTAKGYALAAQAAVLYANLKASTDKERESWYEKAEQAAKKAVKSDPNYAEGYFELARAQGRLAQFRGILSSLGLASSVRDNLNKALKLNPRHVSALVALAIWNLELAQKGVGWLYGASIDNVKPLFEKAIKLEPNEVAHRLEYGFALYRMKRYKEARVQLEKALELPARTYADKMDQQQARELLDEMKNK